MEIIRIGSNNRSYFKEYFSGDLLPGQGALGILDEEESPVGIGVFSVTGDSCILDYLFVEENFRRKGAATLLFTKAKAAMTGNGIRNFLAFYEEDPDVTAFLTSQGFVSAVADPLCSVGVSEVLGSEIYKKLSDRGKTAGVKPVADLTKAQRIACSKMIRQRGFAEELFAEGAYDPQLSVCLWGETEPAGILLAKQEDGDFYVSLLLVDAEQSAAVPMLLKSFADEVSRRAEEEARIYYVDLEGQMSDPMGRFLDDAALIRKENSTVSAVLIA